MVGKATGLRRVTRWAAHKPLLVDALQGRCEATAARWRSVLGAMESVSAALKPASTTATGPVTRRRRIHGERPTLPFEAADVRALAGQTTRKVRPVDHTKLGGCTALIRLLMIGEPTQGSADFIPRLASHGEHTAPQMAVAQVASSEIMKLGEISGSFP